MFSFNKFYRELLGKRNRFNPYDDSWEEFPSNLELKFKSETLSLLKENRESRDASGLSVILGIICHDGADSDYTSVLLQLLDEKWHTSEEDIISVLELIKDPKSVDKLYKVAVDVPDYDEMRALAKKCMWALSAINTPEAIEKLRILQRSDDPIIRENAIFQLEKVVNRK